MGDVNQSTFVERLAPSLEGPVLEVGSRDYGSTPDLRAYFQGATYIGVDMSEGPGVDVAVDLTHDIHVVDRVLEGRRFRTAICMSVLEHVANPFKMAENITSLLDPQGSLVVSVPFAWQVHGYPDDYWRFTPSGIRTLFPEVDFDDSRTALSTSQAGRIVAIDPQLGQTNLAVPLTEVSGVKDRLRWSLFKLLRRLDLMPRGLGHPYLYPPVLIHMFGKKRSSS